MGVTVKKKDLVYSFTLKIDAKPFQKLQLLGFRKKCVLLIKTLRGGNEEWRTVKTAN